MYALLDRELTVEQASINSCSVAYAVLHAQHFEPLCSKLSSFLPLQVIDAPLPRPPVEVGVVPHWLFIEGLQPQIPENTPLERQGGGKRLRTPHQVAQPVDGRPSQQLQQDAGRARRAWGTAFQSEGLCSKMSKVELKVS